MAVFTAGTQHYCDKVLSYIDPKRIYISHRFYRRHCIAVEGNQKRSIKSKKNSTENVNNFTQKIERKALIESLGHHVKDLRMFKNIDLNKVILVDNSISSYCCQMWNGIPVKSYMGISKAGNELVALADQLDSFYDSVQENFRALELTKHFLGLDKFYSFLETY